MNTAEDRTSAHDREPERLTCSLDELVKRAGALAVAGSRRILGIAGAPGAGKSTVAQAIADALGGQAARVGMDAFHLANAVLAAHGSRDRKGAPDTFDPWGYANLLRRLKTNDEPVVYAPVFDRSLEESIGSAVPVARDVPLVITEGNYLLLDAEGWRECREQIDEVWFLDISDGERQLRLREAARSLRQVARGSGGMGAGQRPTQCRGCCLHPGTGRSDHRPEVRTQPRDLRPGLNEEEDRSDNTTKCLRPFGRSLCNRPVPADRCYTMTTIPVLEARGLTRSFGNVRALDGVDFDVHAGEVVALIGDNGAGKSTLVKALSGNLALDSGKILFAGGEVDLGSPSQASSLGIETVYQDLALAPHLNPAQNMFLGREIPEPGLLGQARVHGQQDRCAPSRRKPSTNSAPPCAACPPPSAPCPAARNRRSRSPGPWPGPKASSSSTSQRPPSAWCRPRTCSRRSARVRDHGVGVVFISHSMPHVIEVADRVQVLRLGRRVATYEAKNTTMEELVGAMTGALDGAQLMTTTEAAPRTAGDRTPTLSRTATRSGRCLPGSVLPDPAGAAGHLPDLLSPGAGSLPDVGQHPPDHPERLHPGRPRHRHDLRHHHRRHRPVGRLRTWSSPASSPLRPWRPSAATVGRGPYRHLVADRLRTRLGTAQRIPHREGEGAAADRHARHPRAALGLAQVITGGVDIREVPAVLRTPSATATSPGPRFRPSPSSR